MAIDPNVVDIDGNTPLHLATQQGHCACIEFLIKILLVDYTIKNKFGYKPYDIAYNNEVRKTLATLIYEREQQVGGNQQRVLEGNLDQKTDNDPLLEEKNDYGRRQFNGVLLHNDRVSKLKTLMHKFGQVEQHLKITNQ